MKKIILDLCGGTGAWSKPYREAEYDVRIITLPDNDIRNYKPPKNVYGILAAPPCTMFSLARTRAKIPRNLNEGMELVKVCMNIIWLCRSRGCLKFWALENPMGYLRQFMGKPAMTFDPSEFGENYNKTTDLWGYFNEPIRKRKIRYDSTDDNTRVLPPIPDDYKIDSLMRPVQIRRSMTPEGFAKAFFKYNQ